MSDWGVGFVTGMVVGWVIGFIATRRQRRQWSEMSRRDKTLQIGLVAAGVLLLLTGIIILLVLS